MQATHSSRTSFLLLWAEVRLSDSAALISSTSSHALAHSPVEPPSHVSFALSIAVSTALRSCDCSETICSDAQRASDDLPAAGNVGGAEPVSDSGAALAPGSIVRSDGSSRIQARLSCPDRPSHAVDAPCKPP